ncbi:MAG: glycosyl hydrolase [Oceanospirillales bacterium]|nr:glycosyl hydrolase [Oceanospirillales bacterium]
MSGTLLVATAGQGVVKSADNGQTWHRLSLGQEIEFDAITRSLDMDPQDPRKIYLGTDTGLCISVDAGANWKQMDTPFNGQTVWKVAVDPNNPKRIFVGTGAPSRAALWRTTDGGQNWQRGPVDIPERCAGVSKPRLLAFSFDPTDSNILWFGLEEGGLFKSVDGGDSWERVDSRLLWEFHTDIHAVRVLPNHGKKVVVVVCVNAVYRSLDDGETWEGLNPNDAFGLYYARAAAVPAGSEDTLYLSISDGTPGTTSQVLVSRDAAATWQVLPLPQQPNSCIWGIHVNPANHDQVVMGTKYGHLFTSENGGKGWKKEWREFSEIADVLWTPATAEIVAAHQSVIKN